MSRAPTAFLPPHPFLFFKTGRKNAKVGGEERELNFVADVLKRELEEEKEGIFITLFPLTTTSQGRKGGGGRECLFLFFE